MYFDLTKVKHEDVSLAVSWLKATIKNLSYSNDIPNKSVGFILTGMARSHNRTFNTHCSVLEVQHSTDSHGSSIRSNSDKLCMLLHRILDSLNEKYRDLVQHGCWLKAKPEGSTPINRALVTSAPTPSTSTDISTKFSPEDIQALFSQFGVRQCFNPNCRSTEHLAKDCTIPFPATWEPPHSHGRSHDCRPGTTSSRGNAASSNGSQKGPLNQHPVTFRQAYNATTDITAVASSESEISTYDSTHATAFLVHQDDGASKE